MPSERHDRPRPRPAQLLRKSLCWYNFYDTVIKVVSWTFFYFLGYLAVERVTVGMETIICCLGLFFIYKVKLLSSSVLLPSGKFYKARITQRNVLLLCSHLSRILHLLSENTSPLYSGVFREYILTVI